MPQISDARVRTLATTVHAFLAGGPLHEVWAIDLSRERSVITLDEFLRTASAFPSAPPPLVRPAT